MPHEPLSVVADEPLEVTPEALEALAEFRSSPKLDLLPGVDTAAEKARLSALLHSLADRLIEGVAENPSKLWVLTEFQSTLQRLQDHDTEAREHFGMELERLMDILGIESSDGLLSHYLGGL